MLSLHLYKSKKKYKVKVAIVGGGSAGLFLAALLGKYPHVEVHVWEKSAKTGTKLRASGGGKANIWNEHISERNYNNAPFMHKLLQQVNVCTIEQAFHNMGLLTIADSEGRVYPASQFSATVTNVLYENMGSQVHIHTGCEVTCISSRHNVWYINHADMAYDYVVLATGSPAGMIAKNRAGYNHYLQPLHLHTQVCRPSLTGFRIKHYDSILCGCRAKAVVKLYQGSTLLMEEAGEITFKEDGLSGIVILNASAYYNRLKQRQNCYLEINFLYAHSAYNVQQHVQKYGSPAGLVHPKICELYKQKHIDVQHYRMEIADTYDYDTAQVCAGGISTDEINDDFELKKHPHLYAIGEMLDIDGVCGGYNLFFAFAGAYRVHESIIHGNKNS